MIGQDVVERDVLHDVFILEDEGDVLRALVAERVPQVEQGLLVVVDGDGGLRELRMEQRPQVHEVGLKQKLLLTRE